MRSKWTRPPAACRSSQGLLLVEAILAAIVIATGLAFISRGLAGQLGALRTIEERETLTALARSTLLELETQMAGSDTPVDAPFEGTAEDPDSGTGTGASYTWAVRVTTPEALKDASGNPFAREVTMTVTRDRPDGRVSSVELAALWPIEWIPSTWPGQ